jgi:hypothetical protein
MNKSLLIVFLLSILLIGTLSGCTGSTTTQSIPPPQGYSSWDEYNQRNNSTAQQPVTTPSSTTTPGLTHTLITSENEPAQEAKSINGLLIYFQKNGLEIQSQKTPAFTTIDAIDGCKLTINNVKLEVYEYALDNPTLERIRITGIISTSFYTYNAYVNGSLVLFFSNENEPNDIIINLFINY